MSTILIHVPPMVAHVNPTFRLAKDLQSRGHSVTYISATKRLEAMVRAHGLNHRLMPVGWQRPPQNAQRPGPPDAAAPQATPPRQTNGNGNGNGKARHHPPGTRAHISHLIFGGLRDRSALIRRAAEQMRDDREFRQAIDELSPDLVLVDSLSSVYVLPLLAWDVPVAMLSPTLPTGYDANVPPLCSHFIPDESVMSRVGCAAAWARHRGIRRLTDAAMRCMGGFGPGTFLRDVTRHYGLDCARVIDQRRYWKAVLRVPELILCPEAFDFPRAPRPDMFYVDSSVRPDALESKEDASFPWHRIRPDMELVYCAFGSVVTVASARAKRLLAGIAAAFATQKRFQLVLKLATAEEVAALGDLPDHVIAVHEWVPQIALLRRAAVHITHAGFMSVRESIECAVPMVAIPLHHRVPGDADHPGTAARIEYHGIGRRLRPRAATGEKVLELARHIADTPRYKKSMCDMKLAFERHREEHNAADVVETLLRH